MLNRNKKKERMTMYPIEVIRVINNPEKYAKTKKQKDAVKRLIEITGFGISLDKKTGIRKGGRLQ